MEHPEAERINGLADQLREGRSLNLKDQRWLIEFLQWTLPEVDKCIKQLHECLNEDLGLTRNQIRGRAHDVAEDLCDAILNGDGGG